jgi:hypothetical protein
MKTYEWKALDKVKNDNYRKEINRTLLTTILNAQHDRIIETGKNHELVVVASKDNYERLKEVNDIGIVLKYDEKMNNAVFLNDKIEDIVYAQIKTEVAKKSDTMFLEENYELVDIDSIETIEDERVVYDLEVEEDHTYVLKNDIISHNSRAKAGKSMLKEMTRFCGKYRVPFVFTNHTYKDVASAPNPMYAKFIQAGGNQPTYMSSAVIMLNKKEHKDENDKKNKLGNFLIAKSEKNRLCPEGRIVESYVSFDKGPNKFYGLMEDGINAGVFEKVDEKNVKVKHLGDKKVRYNKLYTSEVFTPEVLDIINEYCKGKYRYSTVDYEGDGGFEL